MMYLQAPGQSLQRCRLYWMLKNNCPGRVPSQKPHRCQDNPGNTVDHLERATHPRGLVEKMFVCPVLHLRQGKKASTYIPQAFSTLDLSYPANLIAGQQIEMLRSKKSATHLAFSCWKAFMKSARHATPSNGIPL